MTVAGVHAAVRTMDSATESRAAEKFGSHVQDNLCDWNKSGVPEFSDLIQFIQRNTQGGLDYHMALGLLVIWNLSDGEPSRSEMDIAPAVDNYLIGAFTDWWNKNAKI